MRTSLASPVPWTAPPAPSAPPAAQRPRLLSRVARWGRARRWITADAALVLDIGAAFGYGTAALAARSGHGRRPLLLVHLLAYVLDDLLPLGPASYYLTARARAVPTPRSTR
jgi:SAM-dependent methyltransferase